MNSPFLLLATQNHHKVMELSRLIPSGIQLLDSSVLKLHEEIPETGNTLEDNALQKARYCARLCSYPVLADDSGLEVDALNGEPGVFSARYAGAERSDTANIQKLLGNLSGSTNRRARFRTVLALVWMDKEFLFQGVIEGEIAEAPRGMNGFGYDPVFVPEHSALTFAEMTPDEKNTQSHRARAIASFIQFLSTAPDIPFIPVN